MAHSPETAAACLTKRYGGVKTRHGISSMDEPDDRPTSATQPTDVIVAAVVEWIEGVAELHREIALVLDLLRKSAATSPADERLLGGLVVGLRQRQAQAPSRAAVETWVRSIATTAAQADTKPPSRT
jgi:hypothetical protein